MEPQEGSGEGMSTSCINAYQRGGSTPCEDSECNFSQDVTGVASEDVLVASFHETEVKLDKGTETKSSHHLFENLIEITGAWKDFVDQDGLSYFSKGCKWAPDGTCILTNADDNVLRIFDLPQELHCQESWDLNRTLPEMKSVLRIQEGRTVYDYCWYPLMSSWNPLSCCLVSTSQFSPIHLWDAFTGELRCTYSIFNHLDELDPACSVAFDPSGEKLYAGGSSKVCVFRTGVPGRVCEVRSLKNPSQVSEKQVGLVGCITINPVMSSIYAVGSYAKSVGLYCEPDGAMLCLLQGHTGGVTHMEFSSDGTKLYSGGRKDPEILCWDMRYPGSVLFSTQRVVQTNQRVYFNQTSDGRFLVSGTTEGNVLVWDTKETPEVTSSDPILQPCKIFTVHKDAVCGVSLHQQYPILATSSGQRHFSEPTNEPDDEQSDKCSTPLLSRNNICEENSLKFWWVDYGEHSYK